MSNTAWTCGTEAAAGGEHTIALALRLLARRPDVRLGSLVTHGFLLHRYRQALETACFRSGKSGAVKVVFAPEHTCTPLGRRDRGAGLRVRGGCHRVNALSRTEPRHPGEHHSR